MQNTREEISSHQGKTDSLNLFLTTYQKRALIKARFHQRGAYRSRSN